MGGCTPSAADTSLLREPPPQRDGGGDALPAACELQLSCLTILRAGRTALASKRLRMRRTTSSEPTGSKFSRRRVGSIFSSLLLIALLSGCATAGPGAGAGSEPALSEQEAVAAYDQAVRCGALHLGAARSVGAEALGEEQTAARAQSFAEFMAIAVDSRYIASEHGADVGRLPVPVSGLGEQEQLSRVAEATQQEIEDLANDYAARIPENVERTGTIIGDGGEALPDPQACERFRREAAGWSMSRVSRAGKA